MKIITSYFFTFQNNCENDKTFKYFKYLTSVLKNFIGKQVFVISRTLIDID